MGEFEASLAGEPVAACRFCRASWRDYVDLPSFVDYMLVHEISKNVDAYRISTYLHKHADRDGGLLVMGPLWDFNIAFDNADYLGGYDPAG